MYGLAVIPYSYQSTLQIAKFEAALKYENCLIDTNYLAYWPKESSRKKVGKPTNINITT